MRYWLGIDVGSAFTVAAICREDAGRRALPEVVPLGGRSALVSSVVYLGPDGQVIVGEAAERRAATDPDRVVREFKRRIGAEVPMVIAGVSHSASEIAALVVGWVVERVAQREREPAQGITITHPAHWGADKIQALADALRAVDVPEVMFCTEPQAAASYSTQERVDTGSTIAVYDLGGGTFDAAVVRKTSTETFSVLGVPEGIPGLGGADFDDALFGYLAAAVPALGQPDPEATTTVAATARRRRSVALCRRECTEAKEALSTGTEVTIPVLLPEIQSQVRLVRAEFEDLIRPQVVQTVEALRRALRSADVGPEDLDVVLLIGGSSRMPLVAQLVSAELGRPVTVDADPQVAIAIGAALSGLPADTAHRADTDTARAGVKPDTPVPTTGGPAGFASLEVPQPRPEVPNRLPLAAIPLDVESADVQWRRARPRRFKQIAAAGFLVVVGGVASVPFVISHSDPIPPAVAVTPAPATPVTTTPAPIPSSGNDNSSPGADSTETVHPTPPAIPHKPVSRAAKPKNTARPTPHTTRATRDSRPTSRSKPPASPSPSPPPRIPAWVEAARNGWS
jgi:actin-like ATPase involved in cell morphogenesis